MAVDVSAVHKPAKKLRKVLGRLKKRPSVGDVHDLRTNTRRLEAAAAALRLPSPGPLERLRKQAGDVRDMDVLTALAAQVEVDGETECLVTLLEHLGAKRKKYARRLEAEVGRRGGRARRRLKKLSRVVDARGTDDAAAAAAALKLETELHGARPLGEANLHPFRLQVKELRNTLRLARDGDDEVLGALDAVKDAIGLWHDWAELYAEAKGALPHGRKCALLRELRRRTKKQYRVAMQQALRLRRRYFDGHQRAVEAAATLSA